MENMRSEKGYVNNFVFNIYRAVFWFLLAEVNRSVLKHNR